ncbi:hypothetical protein RND81_13G062200 [Saponaria officinalis]|uniref:DUF8039 domain-containing protein n=1 Tax=Saponaria officinalis TaxID=3572 RepID=A0AAW1GUB3_SAPOF
MSSSRSNSSTHSNSENLSTAKKGKSLVLMKELITLRNSGLKLDVEFDKNGESVGTNADKYKSYIGVLSRTKVPIDIPCWGDVPVDIKEKIWDDVLTVFNIPMSKKKQVISIANSRWNNFKSILTSLYVFKKPLLKRKLLTDDDPLTKYPYIKAEVWKKFKESRLTEEFQASSKLAAEKQKQNIYPHRMSREEYPKTMMKLEAKKRAADPLTCDTSMVTIERGDLWIEGRLNKDGECLNAETKEATERINLLKEQVSQGGFTPNGKDDVLTKALGKKEHYGRVRGLVGHKQYFGKSSYRRGERLSKMDLDMITQMITKKVRADMHKEMEHYFQHRTIGSLENIGRIEKGFSVEKDVEVEVNGKSKDVEVEINGEGKDVEHDLFNKIPIEGVEFELAVLEKGKVALGKVFRAPNDDSRSHGRAFGLNELRVSIDVVFEGLEDIPLPLTTEEFSTVGEAQGSFVRWPKNLISLRNSQQSLDARIVDNNFVHWFDPLGHSQPSDFKNFINLCIRVYGFTGGKRKSSKAPQWVHVKCARQPGVIECGYYIMRYMLELVTRINPAQPIDEHFQDTTPYSKEDIDEVRDLWADYFLNV